MYYIEWDEKNYPSFTERKTKNLVKIDGKIEDFSVFFEGLKTFEINKETLDYFRSVKPNGFTIQQSYDNDGKKIDDTKLVLFSKKCIDYIENKTNDLSFLNK